MWRRLQPYVTEAARHRCEVDLLCQRPLCSGAQWSALLPWEPPPWGRTSPSTSAYSNYNHGSAESVAAQAAALELELAPPPNPHDPAVQLQQLLAQAGDTARHLLGQVGDATRQLLAHGGAEGLEREDWIGGGSAPAAARRARSAAARRIDFCWSERWAARSGAAVQLFSVGELLLSLRTATSRELARHGYRRGYAVWLLTIDTALSLDFLAVHGPDALLLTLDRWLSPSEPTPAEDAQGSASARGALHLHERLLGDAAAGIARAWDGVQRAWRDTPLVRAVVGYQRLNELPPAPWPIQRLLDEQLLPAYFGEGLQALIFQIEVLPAIGDLILETMLLQAFVGSFVRSAKALILLASAAKALRVRRRLRHEHAARRIVRAWRQHARRRRASRQVARLRWHQTISVANAAQLRSRRGFR